MSSKLLQLARENVATNPRLQSLQKYVDDIAVEVEEVRAEMKSNNQIYLTDELSDVLWNYFNVLVLCEREGLIESAEDVFVHGVHKYSERLPAMIAGSQEQWDVIKQKQKRDLQKRSDEK